MNDAESKMFLGILQINDPVMMMMIGTIAFGGLIIIVGYILGRRSRCDRTENAAEIKVKASECESLIDTNAKTTTSTNNTVVNPSGGNKRAKKKRREAQQEFTHTWMVGALKGHTGPVLDMNFSSNGKFLASCAEDCGLAPKDELEDITSGGTETTTTSGYYKVSQKMSNSDNLDDTIDNDDDKSEDTSNISSGSSTASASSLSTKDSSDSSSSTREQGKSRPKTSRKRGRRGRGKSRHQCLQTNSSTHSSDSGSSGVEKVKNIKPRHEQTGTKKANRCNDKVNSVVNVKVLNNGAKVDKKVVNTVGQTIKNFIKFYSIERLRLVQFTDAQLTEILSQYLIRYDILKDLGYPHADTYHPDRVRIRYRSYHAIPHRANHRNQTRHDLDVNAREFIPSNYITQYEVDSGTGSGSSQENSDLELEVESSPTPSRSESAEDIRKEKYFIPVEPIIEAEMERTCVRCAKSFHIDSQTGDYIDGDGCTYHWGKYRTGPTGGFWNCCDGSICTPGCTKARMHVWSGLIPGYNGYYSGYVRTQPATYFSKNDDYGVYALDCEMCYTKRGLELTRVTVANIDGSIVYDKFVKPDEEIIDYNTRFSGITVKHLDNVTTTLRDVQQDLTRFISSETILMGHALENDLRALKIVHTRIIDTSVPFMNKFYTFEHGFTYGCRSSLKTLARRELQREIQVGEHDSVEDARVVVDIVLRRLWSQLYIRTYNYGENEN